MKKALLIFLLVKGTLYAQTKTIGTRNNERDAVAVQGVMIIPFEPRMYMSEVDHNFNRETGMSAKEIRARFRAGINEQLYRQFRQMKFSAIDLLADTVRYKKDLEGIYQYLTYLYMRVPDPDNYKPPVPEKEEKKINKGQLTVETGGDKRFMNARLTSPRVVPGLHSKFKTDVFVFINQLDIKLDSDPNVMIPGSTARKITVHYTVFTYNGQEISSGIVEETFEGGQNNPRKIIDKQVSKIALTIVKRVHKALLPKK